MDNAALFKELRRENGLTQKQVANYLHMDRSTYAYYEIGRTKPTIEFLMALARLYGVSLNKLLGAQPAREPREGAGMLFPELSREEQKLVLCFRCMDAAQRKALLGEY
ncbi:MAG: helix-turn-helix domain-containing protein [Firmicutes bacterium]|nr:helix-turn-helix domain-containing protein [Bacillota bacterium]